MSARSIHCVYYCAKQCLLAGMGAMMGRGHSAHGAINAISPIDAIDHDQLQEVTTT